MKIHLYKLLKLFFGISLFLLISCSKSDSTSEVPSQNASITGKIILPNDSTLDASSLTVVSPIDDSAVTSGNYELNVTGLYNATFALTSTDEVLMIGYNYPGVLNHDITPESTALGMIMMSPLALDLSDEGKHNLIAHTLGDANFILLLNEVRNSIQSGSSIYNSSNSTLINALKLCFESAQGRHTNNLNTPDLPVNMFRSNRNFTFNNSLKEYTTVIGVYKDNQRIAKISVEGMDLLPNSIGDVLSGTGGATSDPTDSNYLLSTDGNFQFKFRTGYPGSSDGSTEYNEAFYENLAKFSYNFMITLLPGLGKVGCKTTIINTLYNTISTTTSISSTDNIAGILYKVKEIALNAVNGYVECTNTTVKQKWITAILKNFELFNNVFSVISNGANNTIFAYQWGASQPANLCFSATGSNVTKCGATTGCDNSTLTVTATSSQNAAAASATGGVSPYTYSWSNGNNTSTVTNLQNGTYTVTVTDSAGCTAVASVVVNTTPSPCDDTTTPYPTVTIGGQVWMQKNLNVCKYRNGDDIPQVQDPNAWKALTTGAWCYQENNTANGTIYGKLYNWYAVNDPRGLAPAGWHVPSDAEWSILGTFLGGNPVAGGKMKSTTGWNPPNTGATNESGFTALPSGYRGDNDGIFYIANVTGYWWSATEYDTDIAWSRYISYYSTNLYSNNDYFVRKRAGFSVRCIRD